MYWVEDNELKKVTQSMIFKRIFNVNDAVL
jgi:hypothetical protein